MYSQYVKEREGVETVELETGFYSYKLEDSCLFIVDLFVLPEFRSKKVGSEYGEQLEAIAKKNGKNVILCAASLAAKNSEDAINFILSNGYKIINVTLSEIYFKKEL